MSLTIAQLAPDFVPGDRTDKYTAIRVIRAIRESLHYQIVFK
jgi:hypothetical protein